MTTDEIHIDQKLKNCITSDLAWYFKILPASQTDGKIIFFATEKFLSNPSNRQEVELMVNSQVEFVPASELVIERALSTYYLTNSGNNNSPASKQLEVTDRDFVSALIDEARLLKSSDIHIERYEEKCRIRFRIDGKLLERITISKLEYPAVINKIKIMAGLDISEKRLPQDGRIFFNFKEKFDIRVSVLPTLHGEKIVLRLLSSNAINLNLDSLGFAEGDLALYKQSIRRPNGIVFISGPTGSGKTTTLYSTLRLLNKDTENIVTIEDPVEYTLSGINQVQVKEDIGLSFARALRSFLRQDPDIIMVGEVRDSETANLAIRAALTGHLVLSTIHTNSAWGTIARLTDMGIPSFLLSGTLNATIAQRLVRTLCPACKAEHDYTPGIFPTELNLGQFRSAKFYDAVGCAECFYTGFKGRRAIYEIIVIDKFIADFLADHSQDRTQDIFAYLSRIGTKTLRASAVEILEEGETTVTEIYSLLLNDQF